MTKLLRLVPDQSVARVDTYADVEADWEDLNGLIGLIYECALDPSLWNHTLSRMALALCPSDWHKSMFFREHRPSNSVYLYGEAGLPLGASSAYQNSFAFDNPFSQSSRHLRNGTVFDSEEMIDRGALEKSKFFENFLKPLAIEQAVALHLDRTDEERIALAFAGPLGRPLDRLKRGLRVLAPHIQRAIRVSHRIASLEVTAGAAKAGADTLPFAVISLDAAGTILSANGAVERYTEAGAIAAAYSRLYFTDPVSQRKLSAMLDDATMRSLAFQAPDREGVECPVLATRIPEQTVPAIGSTFIGASLIVTIGRRAGEAPALEIAHVAQWFGLTPKQARLASALAAGGSLQEYSDEQGISINSTKSLLKIVFSKTATTSQAQLIGLLARLPS